MSQSNVYPLRGADNQVRYLSPKAAHARIYSEWRHFDSFRTLTPLQRCLLEDMLMEFSKVEGAQTRLTCNGVMSRYKVGHATAKMAIAGLEERGWIERVGLSPGPTGQAGGLYRILCIASNGSPIAGRYQSWQAPRSR